MGAADEARFAHRLTGNQTFESICLRCFRTVGSATLEQELESAEQFHACLPEDLIVLHGRMEPEAVSSDLQKKNLA